MRIFAIAATVIAGLAFFYLNQLGNAGTAEVTIASADDVPENKNAAILGLMAGCEVGVPVAGIVGVNGREDVLSGPSASSKAIVNTKATDALGKIHYQSVDHSQTVRRLCEEGEWTLMEVVTPDWLTHVRGWVPSASLRAIQSTASGKRVYVDADFSWDGDTRKYAEEIVTVINQISQENNKCGTIDTGTLSLSSSRSTPNKSVFYVTCGTGGQAFNVWFSPDDVKSGTSLAAIEPIGQSAATSDCKEAATAAATHPSTVDFDMLAATYGALPSGRASLESRFTAKNGFNLELSFNIRCLFDGNSMIESAIWESAF